MSEDTAIAESAAPAATPRSALGRFAVFGPGLSVMLADADAGNVVTGAQAGASWGYRLLPLLLLLIPMLYTVQELTVRLAIGAGRGFGELIRARFGAGWAWASLVGLAVAAFGSLVTEFTGVAGVGELYGLPRALTLPCAVVALLAIVGAGSYRRVERIAIFVGLFELAFFIVAWAAHPGFAALASDAVDLPLANRDFLFMTAAIIGAVFNPWMIFYQQSALVERKLAPGDLRAARLETAFGAALTQGLTAAVLIAAAATLGRQGASGGLDSVGEISDALTPLLGATFGRLAFSAGVLGASLVAAIVCSLALAWGAGELVGRRRARDRHPFTAPWLFGLYALCVVGAAALVDRAPDLVRLNIAAQALNVLLLPFALGLLVVLAARGLPPPLRVRGAGLWALFAMCALVVSMGVFVGVHGWSAFP